MLCVRPALTHPNVTLRTHVEVTPLERDSSGRSVKRVVVQRRGAEEAYGADIVVVSCGAVNSAALLLRSTSAATSTGWRTPQGRRAARMAHLNSAVIAISRTTKTTKSSRRRSAKRLLLGAGDSQPPLGHIQMLGKSDADILRTGAPRFVPGLPLDYAARKSLDFWLITQDLPHPDNRVTADRAGNIHLAKTQHNTEPHRRLLAKLKDLLGPLGCHRTNIPRWSVLSSRSRSPIAHNCGTVRFGTDPERRRSISTARRTTSITSTSSTPASSRPSSAVTLGSRRRSPPRCASATTFSSGSARPRASAARPTDWRPRYTPRLSKPHTTQQWGVKP